MLHVGEHGLYEAIRFCVGSRVCFRCDQRVANPDRCDFVFTDSAVPDFVRASVRVKAPYTSA